MPDLVLPPIVDHYAQGLTNAGFVEIRREAGSMGTGVAGFRREPIELWFSKDRGGHWFLDVAVDGWRSRVAFPALEGCSHGEPGGDAFPPRRDRDPARHYDVPPAVRWLIRQLLSAKLAESPKFDRSHHLVFQRDPLTVAVDRRPQGWAVDLSVEHREVSESLALPRFVGFANP